MKTTTEKHNNEKASIKKHSESHHGPNTKKMMEDHSKKAEQPADKQKTKLKKAEKQK